MRIRVAIHALEPTACTNARGRLPKSVRQAEQALPGKYGLQGFLYACSRVAWEQRPRRVSNALSHNWHCHARGAGCSGRPPGVSCLPSPAGAPGKATTARSVAVTVASALWARWLRVLYAVAASRALFTWAFQGPGLALMYSTHGSHSKVRPAGSSATRSQ